MTKPAPAGHRYFPGKTIQDLCLAAVSEAGLTHPQTGEVGHVRFVPGEWISTYLHWIRNIQDWCISRQLWWGHHIPPWYDDDAHIFIPPAEPASPPHALVPLHR